ncbi:O-antigen ligase family protein [Rodentibacter caecimuris]|uniref:RfaL protein n=1 Tax=Rodentibacter caecimuris TaxID=1796644 RepID=A0ABX3KWX8_9PAST|nr:RfaL protein [Rodentibacter heylii]
MQISKQNRLVLLINVVIAFFFLSILSLKGGHNFSPILLMVLGLGYVIYASIKKWKFNLSKEDYLLIFSYIFYFSVFLLSFLTNSGKMRELDNPSRVILLIPTLILLLRTPIRIELLLLAMPLGSFIAGSVALYDRVIIGNTMAFAPRTMHIQGGDISMSLGMFSLAIALFFAQKTRWKLTALCVVSAFFGILGSFLSTARGGWIALPIGLIAMFWIYRQSLPKSFFIGIFSLLIISIIGLSKMPNSLVVERIEQAQQNIHLYFNESNGNTSLGARFDMWKSALIMAKEKPILGWGTQGAEAQRKEHAKSKIISNMAGNFNHAHNQYLDDLSKRGLLGLIALLVILFIPLYSFKQHLKKFKFTEQHNESVINTQLFATLGIVHILLVIFYCLSQGFFTHNSGNIFYFFLIILFYAVMKQTEKQFEKRA